MRRDAEYFGDQELELILIAKKLKEALKAEDTLNQAGVDYLIETDTYSGGVIFRTQRVGAFFYVVPEEAARGREALSGAGIRPQEIE